MRQEAGGTATADVVVIGGGVVGLAIAHTCALYFDQVFVLEREARCGTQQSTRNSGVIHPGIHYPTTSLKAQLCVAGNRLMYEFCRRHSVAHRQTGELIVAVTEAEEVVLASLAARARDNGSLGVTLRTGRDAALIQPGVVCRAALFVPSTGVVDAGDLLSAVRTLCQERGVDVLTQRWPTHIEQQGTAVRLAVRGRAGQEGDITCRVCINAAGLQAAAVARLADPHSPWQTVAVRGEYAVIPQPASRVMMPVYRVPHTYPMPDGTLRQTLGVHLTPTVGAGGLGAELWVGPSVKVLDADGDVETGRYPAGDLIGQVTPFFSGIDASRARLGHAGITPRLLGAHADFVIERDRQVPGVLHLLGIDSPGLTSVFALAIEVATRVLKTAV